MVRLSEAFLFCKEFSPVRRKARPERRSRFETGRKGPVPALPCLRRPSQDSVAAGRSRARPSPPRPSPAGFLGRGRQRFSARGRAAETLPDRPARRRRPALGCAIRGVAAGAGRGGRRGERGPRGEVRRQAGQGGGLRSPGPGAAAAGRSCRRKAGGTRAATGSPRRTSASSLPCDVTSWAFRAVPSGLLEGAFALATFPGRWAPLPSRPVVGEPPAPGPSPGPARPRERRPEAGGSGALEAAGQPHQQEPSRRKGGLPPPSEAAVAAATVALAGLAGAFAQACLRASGQTDPEPKSQSGCFRQRKLHHPAWRPSWRESRGQPAGFLSLSRVPPRPRLNPSLPLPSSPK